jgi:hypothetical protein
MGPFSASSGAVAYWIFIGAVVVAAIASRVLRQREVQKTIRAAIQSGQPLDPAVLDQLQAGIGPFGMGQRTPQRRLASALVLTAVGPALWIIAFFNYLEDRELNFTLVGVGAAISLIGLVLVGLAAWTIREERLDRREQQNGK